MKTGISTASMFLKKSTEDAAAIIKDFGAETAEIFYQTFYEYRPEFSKALAPAIDGLDVCAVHALSSNFEPQLLSRSRRARGDGYYWLDQIMRSAQLLNCKRYIFHGGLNLKGGGGPDINELAGCIREAVLFCARYGVELSIENVSWSTYNRPGIFSELKSRIPELTGVFDIKQARRSGYPYQAYIRDMAGSISHVHLSDIDENGWICLPDKGIYDFGEIFRRLKDAGFDGSAVIEVYSKDYENVEELKRALDYINEII